MYRSQEKIDWQFELDAYSTETQTGEERVQELIDNCDYNIEELKTTKTWYKQLLENGIKAKQEIKTSELS